MFESNEVRENDKVNLLNLEWRKYFKKRQKKKENERLIIIMSKYKKIIIINEYKEMFESIKVMKK